MNFETVYAMRHRSDVVNDIGELIEWWRIDREKLASENNELRKIISELEKRISSSNIAAIHSVADRYKPAKKIGLEKYNDGYIVYIGSDIFGFVKRYSKTSWAGETKNGKHVKSKTRQKVVEMMING